MKWVSTTEEVIVSRARIQEGADRADALWNELDCSVTIQLLQFVGLDGNPDWAVARGGDNAITILTQSERILR